MFKLDSLQIPHQISQAAHDREKVYQWVIELCNAETRENALSELRQVMVYTHSVPTNFPL